MFPLQCAWYMVIVILFQVFAYLLVCHILSLRSKFLMPLIIEFVRAGTYLHEDKINIRHIAIYSSIAVYYFLKYLSIL